MFLSLHLTTLSHASFSILCPLSSSPRASHPLSSMATALADERRNDGVLAQAASRERALVETLLARQALQLHQHQQQQLQQQQQSSPELAQQEQ